MGKPSPPSPPDPTLTANAQTSSNVDTAAANAALNKTDQFTPWGSTVYQPTGSYTTSSGETVPMYSQYTSLSPLGQSILTGEQGVANTIIPAANTLAEQAAQSSTNPLDFNATPFAGTLQNWTQAGGALNNPSLTNTILASPQALGGFRSSSSPTIDQGPQLLTQNVTDAIYGQQKGFLDPQWGQQQRELQDQLSRQGIPVGSEAYGNAMQQFDNSKTQAYQSAQDSAIAGGTGAASNLFGMALQGQNQGLGQQEAAINAALQGQGLSNSQQNQAFNQALSGQQQQVGQQQLGQSNAIALLQQLMGAAPATQSQPVATPVPSSVAPTDVIGAQGLSTNAANQNFQAQTSQSNATMGGIASIAGAAAIAIAL